MRFEAPQANGLKVHVETEPTVSGRATVFYCCCDGQRIGFRLSGDKEWRGVKLGYDICGGGYDGGVFDPLVVERTGTRQ
jgi:hypothetical protein